MTRDNHQCRACGSKELPELCHVTPASKFQKIEDSYADDNLLILCVRCHAFHEWRGKTSESLDVLIAVYANLKESLFANKYWAEAFTTKALWEWARAQRLREALAHRERVEAIFAHIRYERGYTTAEEFHLLRQNPVLKELTRARISA